MNPPNDCCEFLDLLRQSEVVPSDRLDSYLRSRRGLWKEFTQPDEAVKQLVADGILSRYQTKQLLQGKYRGFWINKYLMLESLASGGMGQVVLCEQTPMGRLVAVKILSDKDPGALERFRREARAVAALDHPNIVRAIDIDQEPRFHFLVMEYVDGTNLQDLVNEHGRLEVSRACHYIAQAALGLQHAHEAGWVHRDIKPGNLLVDRSGVVKILDLGLARLTTDDHDNLTKRIDENAIMGTADYLAPEQSLPDQIVDSRADIYSLGITLYFLLAGQPPFAQGTVLQKIMAHQMQKPRSILSLRPGLPKNLVALIEKMMDKSPGRRPQTAREVAEALTALFDEGEYGLQEGEYIEHCPRVRQLLQTKGPVTPPSPLRAEKLRADVIPPRADSVPAVPQPAAKDQPTAPSGRPRFIALLGAGVLALVIMVAAGVGGTIWWFGPRSHTTKAPPRPEADPKDKKNILAVVGGVVTPEQAVKNLNKICTVQMVVRSSLFSKKKKKLFLNSQPHNQTENNFRVVVEKLDGEPGADEGLLTHFRDKTIRVTGQVTISNDQPQLIVADLQKVQIVDK